MPSCISSCCCGTKRPLQLALLAVLLSLPVASLWLAFHKANGDILFNARSLEAMTLSAITNTNDSTPQDHLLQNNGHNKISTLTRMESMESMESAVMFDTLHPTNMEEKPPQSSHTQNNKKSFPTDAVWPELSSILLSNNDFHSETAIVGDPQFLLDFAVIGFGKCGSTTVMEMLASHDSVRMFTKEVYLLGKNKPSKMIRKLYMQLPSGHHYFRGYKSPSDARSAGAYSLFRQYFPKTKLIVGIRHPLSWFKSYYNFHLQNSPPARTHRYPTMAEIIAKEKFIKPNTATGDFAYHLFKMGKTINNATRSPTALELKILKRYDKENFRPDGTIPNPVFLFEVGQLYENPEQFQNDLQAFLGLPTPFHRNKTHHVSPGKVWDDPSLQALKDERKIHDMCQPELDVVRRALVEVSRDTAQWLLSSFLDAPGVVVSNRGVLDAILRDKWMRDPCNASSVSQKDADGGTFTPNNTKSH